MTDARAQIYENALWLVKKITDMAEADAGIDGFECVVAIESLGGLIKSLRDGEPKRRPSWERALDRHRLSLVRDA